MQYVSANSEVVLETPYVYLNLNTSYLLMYNKYVHQVTEYKGKHTFTTRHLLCNCKDKFTK